MNSTQKNTVLITVFVGLQFCTFVGGDEDDFDVVTVIEVTPTHVLIESSGDWNGWRPIDLIAEAIAEASAQRSPRI